MLAVYTFANISGAHLNPAVTFALMCTGHMKWWKGLLYMVMQVSRLDRDQAHSCISMPTGPVVQSVTCCMDVVSVQTVL